MPTRMGASGKVSYRRSQQADVVGSKRSPNSTHLALVERLQGGTVSGRLRRWSVSPPRQSRFFLELVGAVTRQSASGSRSSAARWKGSGRNGAWGGFPIFARPASGTVQLPVSYGDVGVRASRRSLTERLVRLGPVDFSGYLPAWFLLWAIRVFTTRGRRRKDGTVKIFAVDPVLRHNGVPYLR